VTRRHSFVPEDLGLKSYATSEELKIRSPEDSARVVRGILARQIGGAAREIVLANAAAALWVGGGAADLKAGAAKAAEALDSGAAERTLATLTKLSHEAVA
jgi:anthranilate phosphoribosyltransferase